MDDDVLDFTDEILILPVAVREPAALITSLTATDSNGIQVLKTNAFCPTGKGGGVDPTCSPGKGGGGLPEGINPTVPSISSFVRKSLKEGKVLIPKSESTSRVSSTGSSYADHLVKVKKGTKVRVLPTKTGFRVGVDGLGLGGAKGAASVLRSSGFNVDEPSDAAASLTFEITTNSTPTITSLTATDSNGIQVLKTNAFCPTGKGGGVDPTCSPGEFPSVEAAHKEAKKDWKAWAKQLKPHHFQALDDYQSGAYQGDLGGEGGVFDKLRKGEKLDIGETNMILRLGYAVRGAETKRDVMVFRGLGYKETNYKVGDVVEDKAFMSTSMVRSHVEGVYADAEIYGSPTILELKLPKGTPAAYLDAMGKGKSMGEAEVLLPQYTKYKVISVGKDEKGRIVVRGEVVEAWRETTTNSTPTITSLTATDSNGIQVLKTNAFCPTGKGGGVDPTCSPGKGVLGPLKRRDGYTYLPPMEMEEVLPGVTASWNNVHSKQKTLVTETLSKLMEEHPIDGSIMIKETSGAGEAVARAAKGRLRQVTEEEALQLHAAGQQVMDFAVGGKGSKKARYFHNDPTGYTISLTIDGPRGGKGYYGSAPNKFGEYSGSGLSGLQHKSDPSITARMVVIHEYGHLLTYKAGYGSQEIQRMPANKDIARRIGSRYAQKNWAETVAEAYLYKKMGGEDQVVTKFLNDAFRGSSVIRNERAEESGLDDGLELIEEYLSRGVDFISTTNSSPTITSLTATDSNGNEFSLPKSAITNELVQSLTTNAIVRPNPLLMDPTGTGKERKALERAIMSRLKLLKQVIVETIVTEDAFGLKDRPSVYTSNTFCPTGKGGGVDPTCSPGNGGGTVRLTMVRLREDRLLVELFDESQSLGSVEVLTDLKPVATLEHLEIWGEHRGKGNAKKLYRSLFKRLAEESFIEVWSSENLDSGGEGVWKSLQKEGLPIVYDSGLYKIDLKNLPITNLASTQVNITDPKILAAILDIQNRIDPADLVEFEDKSHITVRYGLHDLDPKQVEWIVQQCSSISARLGGLSIFPASESDFQRGGPEFDVLKIDVSSKDLESINRHLGILPNTTTHPDYHPHLTIAYLKPGTGQKYVGASGLEGVELEFKSMVYSDDDRKKTEIVFNAFCPTGKGGGVDPTCSPGKGGVGKSTNEEESKFQSRADDLSTKLKQYSSEYKTEGKSDLSEQADKVAGLLDAGKYEEASKLLLEGDLRYDIPLTVTSVNKLKDNVYLAREFGSDWGTKPEEYEAWRSGGLDSPRGVFFSVDKKGAESYGDEVQSHKVTLKNPLVSTRLEAAYAKLTGRSESEVISQRQKSKDVNDWWRKLDKKVMQEAKKAGHDSVLYTDPAPPAIRELVVFDKKQITTNQPTTNAGIQVLKTNAFCPTGKGGGVDPTCSPGKGGVDKETSELLKWIGDPEEYTDLGISLEDRLTESELSDPVSLALDAWINNPIGHVAKGLRDAVIQGLGGNIKAPAPATKIMKRMQKQVNSSLVNGTAIFRGTEKGTKSDVLTSWSTSRAKAEEFAESNYLEGRGEIRSSKALKADVLAWYGMDSWPKQLKWEEEVLVMSRAAVKRLITSLTTNAGIWEFVTDDQKVDEFIKWIRSQMSVAVLGTMTTLGTTDPDHWLMKHISDVYTKGMGKVFEFIRKPVFAEKMPHYEGTKAEFLKSAFTRPVSPNRVKLLAGRAYSELSGMTDKMATQMQRSLTDGFIRGESPRDIARQLVKDVDGLGRKQANMIASTEITRAYNEGQLDSMEELGVEDVGVSVEWRVSKQGVTVLGNPSPCPVCAPLNGIVLKISEARGLLPRHPHCRCAWVASGVGESTKGQKRSQQRIVQAVKSSLLAERPKRKKTAAKPSRWAGSKAKIGKNRPKSILD